MIGRLFAFLVLAFVAAVATSASSGGTSARGASERDTPARYRGRLETALAAERSQAEEAERGWRYETGQMGAAERAAYEAELEERRRAAAAAAAAARLRDLQRRQSGGGYSSGK